MRDQVTEPAPGGKALATKDRSLLVDMLLVSLHKAATHVNQRTVSGQAHPSLAANRCANDWNALHDAIGSFADHHSTL